MEATTMMAVRSFQSWLWRPHSCQPDRGHGCRYIFKNECLVFLPTKSAGDGPELKDT